jgi:hypothetical protein
MFILKVVVDHPEEISVEKPCHLLRARPTLRSRTPVSPSATAALTYSYTWP